MPTERSKLIKQLDKVFSQFVRMRACDDSGHGRCFTCGMHKHWKEVDAGHFMSRAKMPTRWDELNVQFQCKRCNGFRSGEQYKFAQELDARYGMGTADGLVFESNQTMKFGVHDLRDMIETYKIKVAELKRDME